MLCSVAKNRPVARPHFRGRLESTQFILCEIKDLKGNQCRTDVECQEQFSLVPPVRDFDTWTNFGDRL